METPNYWSKQIQVGEDEIYILGGNDGDAKYEGKLQTSCFKYNVKT